jgi:hypothetical protein
MRLGTVWVSVREEIKAEIRKVFNVPEPICPLWVVPIGHARFWPKAKPRRQISEFVHKESYDLAKIRAETFIRAWPKG